MPDSRLRLLLITDEMEVGGTQRQMVRLAKHLDALGVDVELAYFRNESYLLDELREAGIKTHHVPKRGPVDPQFFVRLRQLFRLHRYHAIHAFAFSAELWTTLAIRSIIGCRPALVTSVRGTYQWYSRRQWQLKAWVSRQSSRVVANSDAGASYAAVKMGLPRAGLMSFTTALT